MFLLLLPFYFMNWGINMNKIIIGKLVNTHGIKGEIRIKSNFKYKVKVFKIGNKIIIDKPYEIMSYRVHKGYDMVTLKGINSINDISFPKNIFVYIDRDEYLNDNEYLDDDLIGFNVCSKEKVYGLLKDIRYISETKKLLVVDNHLIPYEFIKNVLLTDKKIIIDDVEGL